MGKFKVEISKLDKVYHKNKIHELRFTNNGNNWMCFDVSTKELKKIKKAIYKYLKQLEDENIR